jgi:hypothetical protein
MRRTMRGNGSSWETRTRIPRKITRNTIRMIKVSRRRRIEHKHKDSNERQQQGNNDTNRQTDKTTNMIRRIRARRRSRI